MTDARFEDAAARPLRLRAETAEDLKVLAAATQDAAGKIGDLSWMARRRRLVVAMNRFRWEDKAAAERARRPYERVRAALTVEHALGVRARGLDPEDRDAVYSLLDLIFEPGEAPPGGELRLIFSGGAELAVEVEALEATLIDLTRPWETRTAPDHGEV